MYIFQCSFNSQVNPIYSIIWNIKYSVIQYSIFLFKILQSHNTEMIYFRLSCEIYPSLSGLLVISSEVPPPHLVEHLYRQTRYTAMATNLCPKPGSISPVQTFSQGSFGSQLPEKQVQGRSVTLLQLAEICELPYSCSHVASIPVWIYTVQTTWDMKRTLSPTDIYLFYWRNSFVMAFS